MKKILFAALLSLCAIFYLSAQHVIHIYHDGEKQPDALLNVNVDSITLENGNQVFNTKYGRREYPLTSVDSVKFQGPFFQTVIPQVKVPGMASNFNVLAMADSQSGIYPTFATDNLPDYVKYFRQWTSENEENPNPKALLSYIRLELAENSSDTTRHFTLNAKRGDEIVPIEIIQHNTRPLFTVDDQPYELGQRIVFPSYACEIEFKNRGTDVDSLTFFTPDGWDRIECDWMRARTKNDSTIIISIDENLNNTLRDTKIGYHSSIEALSFDISPYVPWPTTTITQLRNSSHTPEEHRKALREFYDATDGDNWTYKGNWWSDEPYYKWDCINHDLWNNEVFWGNRVVLMHFSGRQFTGMRGMIPESFTVFMDDAIHAPDISMGALSGRFPEAVCNHPLWQEMGWGAIQQSLWAGGNIDFTGINLKLPEVDVTDYLANTRRSTSEILQENELTFIIHRAYGNSNNFNEVSFVDKYLGYAPKGLGMVIADSQKDYQKSESEIESYAAIIREMQAKGVPNEIVWTNHFGKAIAGSVGSMSLIDKDGNLIWYGPMDWSLGGYDSVIDSYCRKILGDPVEHDRFVYDTYTSSDYSKDGEFITVQTAEEGNGVDLVFMGDGYVDKDIDGTYIDDMNAGINELFAIEPLKSLKPRFNIYIMKVVSPNEFTHDGEQRLKYDANNVYEYLNKIPGLTPETAHVCVITNRPNDFVVSGYADMNDNGGSIAWIQEGKASSIIVHEAGGHGIGKLLDEYLTGHDDSSLSDEQQEQMRQQLTAMYHARDWGKNLSFYSEPEKAPWAHMMADEDYADEVGMYQGAWMFPTICWRATENSVMNNDYSRFNAPSREAIYKQVMKASEGDSWTFDFAEFKQFDKLLVADSEPNALIQATSERQPYMQLKSPRRLMKGQDGRYVSVPFGNEPQQPDKTADKASPEVLSNGYFRIEPQLPDMPLEKGSYIIIGDQYIEGK